MNALAPLEELDGLLSSAFAAKAYPGAKFMKGFNHLVAAKLASDPIFEGGALVRARPQLGAAHLSRLA
jgi:predicted dinucleotide-binding enzyme